MEIHLSSRRGRREHIALLERKATRRRWLSLAVAALVVATGFIVTDLPAAEKAEAAGNPGVTQDPTTIWQENFENAPRFNPVQRLTAYTGASGTNYTADAAWLSDCNGWVSSFSQATSPATQINDCGGGSDGANAWNRVQQLSEVLGQYRGDASPSSNFAVSAYTQANPGANKVEFRTTSNLNLPAAVGRFVVASMDVAVVNTTINPPSLALRLVGPNGAILPAGGTTSLPANSLAIPLVVKGAAGGGSARVGTVIAPQATLLANPSVGINIINQTSTGTGNDHGFDNIRLLDVTPSLDKSFSPASISVGQTSTLTFTITNTSELSAKPAWSFTDALPSGLTVAGAATTTCPSGVVTGATGATSVTVTGSLSQGMTSCTVSVPVKAAAGTYTNGPSNVTTTGLNPPGTTTLIVNPVPLTCTDTTYALRENGTIVSWTNSSMDTLTTITPTLKITATGTITDANALGISPGGTAAYYYGLNGTTPTIYSWSAATNATTSRPAGITPTTSPVAGAVNPVNGNYYFGGVGAGQSLYMFNPTTGITVQVGRAPSVNASVNASLNGDIAFSAGGDLYYVSQQRLTVVPAASVPTSTSTAQMPGTQLATSAPIVSVGISFDADGSLMLLSQTTVLQTVYKVNPLTGTTIDAAFITLATGVDNTDLASCFSPATLTLKKDVASRVNTGDQFTLNIAASGSSWTSTTTGAATGIQSVFTGPIPGVPGTSYTLSESAAGATDLAQYGSTYQCVDTAHGNTVISSGSARSFTLTYPAANGQAIVCTFTNTPVAPSYTVQKSVSAGPVHQGDTVTYTVLVKNAGVVAYTTANPASFTDDLTAVLDDATYNNDATDGATVSGNTLTWSGPLAVGATTTITYSVTVKSSNTGNNSLVNVVTPTGTGGTCATGQVCTTTTPVLPPLGIQIQKVGEDSTGTVVPMAGSQWAIYTTATGGTALIASVPPVAGKTGLFSASPLTAGTTYYLTETKALTGFQLLAQRVQFTISSAGAITLAAGTSSNISVTTVNGAQTIRVEDVPAFDLPTTGSTGTMWIYLTGGGIILAALMLLAAMQFIKRRRPAPGVRRTTPEAN